MRKNTVNGPLQNSKKRDDKRRKEIAEFEEELINKSRDEMSQELYEWGWKQYQEDIARDMKNPMAAERRQEEREEKKRRQQEKDMMEEAMKYEDIRRLIKDLLAQKHIQEAEDFVREDSAHDDKDEREEEARDEAEERADPDHAVPHQLLSPEELRLARARFAELAKDDAEGSMDFGSGK